MSEPAPSARPYLQLAAFGVVYLVWGSTYVAVRIGVSTLPPLLMGGVRFLAAGAILYAFVRLRGAAAPTRLEWQRASVAGGLMLVAGNGLVTWASRLIASNLAALLITAVPLYMALLDWVRPGGRRPPSKVLAGVALGAMGMVLLVSPGDEGTQAPALPAAPALAVLAVLVAGLCWAAGALYTRYAGGGAPGPIASAQQMLVAGAGLLALGAVRGERLSLEQASLPSLLAFGYLTLFGSLLAYSAFGWLLRVSTPARVSTVAFVNPLVAVVLGWVLLGERLGPRALAGAVALVAAVVLMTARRR